MRTTVFNFELRVVACQRCGAPIPVGDAGGVQPCGYCGYTQAAAPRISPIPRAAPMTGAERLERLRNQDRNPLMPPELIADLFIGVRLLPWKVSEALGRWQELRASVQAGHGDAERAFDRLTRVLADHFGDEGDSMRERALLQAAVEATSSPNLRQSLLCALARAACRVEDFAAAEGWLVLCDPSSDDILADTAYRLSRAQLATQQARYQDVLGTLGIGGDVPIDDEHQPACAVLRANALEQLGRLEEAIRSFDQVRGSALMRHLSREYVAEHADWKLCAASADAAEARQAEHGATLSSRASGAPLVLVIALLGVIGVGGLIVGIFAATGVVNGIITTGGISGLFISALAPLTFFEVRRSRRAKRLRRHGRAELGQVIHARYMGQETMGVPQFMFKLQVFPTKGAPFYASSILHADAEKRARLERDALVVVRMEADRRGDIQLELD